MEWKQCPCFRRSSIPSVVATVRYSFSVLSICARWLSVATDLQQQISDRSDVSVAWEGWQRRGTGKDISNKKKLIKTSPTRDAKPQQIREQFKHERSGSAQVFVDRVLRDGWTVWESTVHSIVDNYYELRTWSLDKCSDTEMKVFIVIMITCYFFCGLALDERVFRHANNISTTLQRQNP